MKRIRYSAKRLGISDVQEYAASFAKDTAELDGSKEYGLLMYAYEAPPKQFGLEGMEDDVECTIDYDKE